MTKPKYQKVHLVLPDSARETFTALNDDLDRDAYIKALRERGWTLDSIGQAIDLSRERIRQICNATKIQEAIRIVAAGHDVPEPPIVPGAPEKKFIEPSPETLQRLLELQPMAQQVRSYGKAFRKEAEEYTYLLNYAHTVEGVTLYRLAKRLGVTHGALRFRLARYGYKPGGGQSRAYTPIFEENRFPLNKK